MIGVSATLEPDGGEVGREVERRGVTFRGHACDFADRAALYRLLDELRDGPPIDVLVNNAGTIRRSPAAEHGDDDWDTVLEVNLTAQFVLTREIGGRMLERGRGKIVFVASLLSFQGGITVPGYAASKGGVAQLTKALRERVGRPRRQRQRGRARLHRDRQHAGAPGRPRPLPPDPRPDPGRALGEGRGHRRSRALPLLPRSRLRARDRATGGWRMAGTVSNLTHSGTQSSRSWYRAIRGGRLKDDRASPPTLRHDRRMLEGDSARTVCSSPR